MLGAAPVPPISSHQCHSNRNSWFCTLTVKPQWEKRHCQIKATEFEKSHEPAVSDRKLTPFGKRSGAVQLEGLAVVKMTFLVEVIVKR